jgi:hypothetical protein
MSVAAGKLDITVLNSGFRSDEDRAVEGTTGVNRPVEVVPPIPEGVLVGNVFGTSDGRSSIYLSISGGALGAFSRYFSQSGPSGRS